MKFRVLRTAGLLTALMLSTLNASFVSAQPGRGQFKGEGRPMNKNQMEKIKLTDDQQKQMADLRTGFQNEMGKINNAIREKEAHLKTLIDTENRDSKDLDKTISDLTGLKGDLIKKGILHRDAVKKILTPEQMRIWDRKAQQHMHAGAAGMGHRGMMNGNRSMMRGQRMMRGQGMMRNAGMRGVGKE
ncbi:MAG: hypothetical protein WC699_04245 [Bacteroidales bacterium]